MAHIDPDEIALYALGERVRPEVEQHLAECPECREEADALARAVLIGRGTLAADRLIAPDPRVWEGVRAELGISDAVSGAPSTASVADRSGDDRDDEAGTALGSAAPTTVDAATAAADGSGPAAARPSVSPVEAASAVDATSAPASRTASARESAPAPAPGPAPARASAPDDELGAQRRRRPGIRTGVALLVAAVVLVGAAIVIPRIIAAPTPLAMTELEALPGWRGASGQAELVELPNGTRQLDVMLDAPAVKDGYREVWLLDRSGDGQVVGLGIIDGSRIALDVPADIDLTKFDVVDVSAEPADGDPAHSQNSIVRGKLRFGAAGSAQG